MFYEMCIRDRGYHGLWPVNHRDENEAQLVVAQREGFAILHLYHVICYAVEVKNGETLSLGNHELSFVLIPMVHWPCLLYTSSTAPFFITTSTSVLLIRTKS